MAELRPGLKILSGVCGNSGYIAIRGKSDGKSPSRSTSPDNPPEGSSETSKLDWLFRKSEDSTWVGNIKKKLPVALTEIASKIVGQMKDPGVEEVPARAQPAGTNEAEAPKVLVKPQDVSEKSQAESEDPQAMSKKATAVSEKPQAVLEKASAVSEKPKAVSEKAKAVLEKLQAVSEKASAASKKPLILESPQLEPREEAEESEQQERKRGTHMTSKRIDESQVAKRVGRQPKAVEKKQAQENSPASHDFLFPEGKPGTARTKKKDASATNSPAAKVSSSSKSGYVLYPRFKENPVRFTSKLAASTFESARKYQPKDINTVSFSSSDNPKPRSAKREILLSRLKRISKTKAYQPNQQPPFFQTNRYILKILQSQHSFKDANLTKPADYPKAKVIRKEFKRPKSAAKYPRPRVSASQLSAQRQGPRNFEDLKKLYADTFNPRQIQKAEKERNRVRENEWMEKPLKFSGHPKPFRKPSSTMQKWSTGVSRQLEAIGKNLKNSLQGDTLLPGQGNRSHEVARSERQRENVPLRYKSRNSELPKSPRMGHGARVKPKDNMKWANFMEPRERKPAPFPATRKPSERDIMISKIKSMKPAGPPEPFLYGIPKEFFIRQKHVARPVNMIRPFQGLSEEVQRHKPELLNARKLSESGYSSHGDGKQR